MARWLRVVCPREQPLIANGTIVANCAYIALGLISTFSTTAPSPVSSPDAPDAAMDNLLAAAEWRDHIDRPELTNWPPGAHNGTEHERHAAFLNASDVVRSGLNPSLFSDPSCSATQM
jgi:hypothetical protein